MGMKKNIQAISEKIANGYYCKKAIKTSIEEL